MPITFTVTVRVPVLRCQGRGWRHFHRRLGSGLAFWILWAIFLGLIPWDGPARQYLPSPSEALAADCPACIWIDYGEQTRRRDGGVVRRHRIRGDRDEADLGGLGLEARVRFLHIEGLDTWKPTDYRIPVECDPGGCHLDISASANTGMELYVHGTCQDKGSPEATNYLAQTRYTLYGNADPTPPSLPIPEENRPDTPPHLDLSPIHRGGYLMTGNRYDFSYRAVPGAVATAKIREKGRILADLEMAPDGTFSYTPPHDPHLDKAGAHAGKETVVWVEADKPHWSVTHTLYLHRSFSAHLRQQPGLLVFGGSMVFFALLTLGTRKQGTQ